MKKSVVFLIIMTALIFAGIAQVEACTNFLITKGASEDGSTMISYAADSHVLYGELYYWPARDHIPGTMLNIYEWDTGKYLGQIPQVEHTYTVVGLMNEHQVSIGETTWGGRAELRDSTAVMDYGSLMFIALQRSRTAREAIEVMTSLATEYGYASSGESFSICDPEEVWFMDLIGKVAGNSGAVWVARRIPDGYISAHANQARIRQFPKKDKKNCLYAPDVIDFAREMGYYEGSDKDFSFADAYAPPDYGALRFCEARVYAMFNRAAPSLNMSMDYVKGVAGAEPMPLWIKPDKKISVHDMFEFMRDHFEGTDFDMTEDIGGGPYSCPYRWRPLTWKVDDVEYVNERATSTQQTGFSFVTQARSWLPGPIGGIIWFSVDDTYSTVYNPVYCGVSRVPYPYAVGTADFHNFSWDSAFWVFNWVSNFAYSRYSEIIPDILIIQRDLEGKYLADQKRIEDSALALYKQSPGLAIDYLTDYSCRVSDGTVKRWKKLGEDLLVKFMDGNLKDELGNVSHPGYPEAWYRKIADETGDHLKLLELESKE
ncbi:MAG: C69 family dipeptidase [Candidatus Krumholzibacteriota bacterium]|nr:C69 family dipeptidase [Candidatus Krumholzibacteriota bacterium]